MQPGVEIKENGRGEKILVVQTSFLGDTVLTTPLFSEIKRRFPAAELSVLCTPKAKSLLEGNPDIQEIIIDDKNESGRGFRALWRKAKDLRERGFTMALSVHKSMRTALLLFLAGIPHRIGFRQSAGWFFYHRRVNRDPTRHDVERSLSLVKALSVDPEECGRELRVEVDPRTREEMEALFRSLGIQRDDLVFGIHPGSVWPTKRWTVQGYAELMVHLKRRYRCELVLFGGLEDREVVARVQELSGGLGISLAGRIGLQELACALERCAVFITNDSGPMHVAVARGVPVVAIFCATTPSLGFYPYSSRAVVVEKDLPCRPCGSHGGRRCPLGTEDCMRLVRAEDVLRGVEELLDAGYDPGQKGADPHLPRFITL